MLHSEKDSNLLNFFPNEVLQGAEFLRNAATGRHFMGLEGNFMEKLLKRGTHLKGKKERQDPCY